MDDETLVRPDSPFLKSRPHIDKRPKLRFKSPKQTEEWLASREKTDYTYSRSASYSESQAQKSLHVISNNYPTPIMSRRSHGGAYTRDETSSATSLVTGGMRRTSARIAARQGLPQVVGDARTPSRNAYTGYSESITTTTVYTDDGSSMCDEVDSSVSSLSSVRGRLFTSEQYADKQLDHLYGLDRDEISDTESTSAIRSSSSSSFSSSQRLFDPNNVASNVVMKSINIVCTVISIVVSTTLRVVETVVVEPVKLIANSIETMSSSVSSSSSKSKSSHKRYDSQPLSSLREVFSEIVRFVSSSSSTFVYQEEKHQKRRRRLAPLCCCLFLLLALLGAASLLGFAGYTYLFASTENETEISPLHDIDKKLELVIGTLKSEEATNTEGGEAGGGGVGGVGGVGGGVRGGGVGCVGINEIQAMIAAGIEKEISVVNHLVHDQQKQLRQQELVIAELQDRFTKIHDVKTVSDINSLDVRITQLHTDLRNIKFLKEGSSWDDMFQSISLEVGTLSDNHAHLVTEVQQFQKMLSDIMPSLDARFSDHSNLLTSAEQQFSRQITQLGAQLKVVESQLNGLLQSDNPNDDDIKMLITMINAHESNMTKLRVDLRAIQTQIAAVTDKDDGDKIHESLASLQSDVSNLSSIVGGIKTTVNQQSSTVSGLEHSNIGLKSEIESLSNSIINLQDHQQKSVADLTVTFGQWESQLETLNKESKSSTQNLSSTVQLVQNDLAATTTQVSHLKADFIQLKKVHEDHQQEILAIKKTPFIQDPHLSPDSRLLVSQLSEETNLLKNELKFLSSTEDEQSQETLEKMNQMIQALAVNVANIQRSIVEDGDVVSQVTLRHLSSLVGDIKHVQQQLDEVQVTGQLSSEAEHWGNAEMNLKKLSNKLSTLRNEVDSIALLRTDLDSVMMDELPQLRNDVLANRRDLWLRLAMISKEYNASVGKLDTKFTALHASYSSAQSSGTISSGEILQINGKITALQSELNALKEIKDQLENMKSTVTDSQKEVMTQKQRLNQLENQISIISNLEIPGDLNNKLSAIGEVQQEISQDMSQFKMGIKEIERHFHIPGTNKWIDINLLNERVGALDIQIEAIHKDLVISTTSTGDASKQPSGLEAELLKLQGDIILLNSVLGVSSDSNQGGTLATLQQRLAVLEDSISGEEKNTQFAVDVSKASEDVILLRSSIEKLSTSVSAVEKVVSAASLENLQSDVTNLKTVFQQLQLDLTKCCKNGSAMAALFMADESSGILDFLMSRFVGRDELDLTKQQFSAGALNMNASDDVNLQVIRNIVNDLMLVNNADKTGMVDFALESAGGSIINTRCSKTYSPKTGLLSIFGIPLWYSSSSPRMVIQPDMNPGNCWAFVGTQGYVVIQLSNFVKITSFSLEHIPKSLSPTGNIDSAPNNFSVVGLAHEYDSEGTELGRYSYDQNGSSIQFFAVQKSNTQAFHIVELKIHSNHGNIEYTCLYRFRVHGILQK